MDEQRNISKALSIFIFCLVLAGCSPAPVPTPYLPPSPAFGIIPAEQSTPTSTEIIITSTCTNDLILLEDLTIPDYSSVLPETSLDKQWLVQNKGTCDWNSAYQLRFVGGFSLAAEEYITLNPARSGTQTIIRIIFTAPTEAGEYVSLWQAYDPNGVPFGEAFFILIVVQP